MPPTDRLGQVQGEGGKYTSLLCNEGCATRLFTDHASGHHWSVVEVSTATLPGARRSHCLIFVTESSVRRVWHYPDDWRALNDAQLVALSWTT